MKKAYFTGVLALTLFCAALISNTVWANTAIGNVLIAKGVVTASGGSGLRTLAKGSEVFLGETVSTASDSFVVIKMADKSKISLRPKSEVTLEKFSQEEDKEEALFDLIKGGLRTISGDIGKKRPENYQVETAVATIGIRGTDFLVRLCIDDCVEEEEAYQGLPRQQSGPSGGSASTKKKDILRTEQDNTQSKTTIDCKPVAEIKHGLYVAVFEGKIYVRTVQEEIELEAVEAMFTQDRETLCLGEIPNFIIQDQFLQKDSEETFTLFNILKNINDDQQWCAVPEA